MSRSEQVCIELMKKGKWTKTNCQLCRKIHRDKCQILVEQTLYIKSDVDRDYDRAVNKEQNLFSQGRIA